MPICLSSPTPPKRSIPWAARTRHSEGGPCPVARDRGQRKALIFKPRGRRRLPRGRVMCETEEPFEAVDDESNFSLVCTGIPATARLLHMQHARKQPPPHQANRLSANRRVTERSVASAPCARGEQKSLAQIESAARTAVCARQRVPRWGDLPLRKAGAQASAPPSAAVDPCTVDPVGGVCCCCIVHAMCVAAPLVDPMGA